MNKDVIVLSGPQGSGKTTIMQKLCESVPAETLAFNLIFADTIYGIHNYAYELLKERGVTPPPGFVKDGKLLQFLGTEWGRNTFGENVWVNCLLGQMEVIRGCRPGEKNLFIISDCRFRNEFDGVDGFKVRLEAPKELRKARCSQWRENDAHPSEVDLNGYAAEGRFHCYVDTSLDLVKNLDHIHRCHSEWLLDGKVENNGFEHVARKYYGL
jgi:energy-coupling factor transporter ATP-binding protein EcfA2